MNNAVFGKTMENIRRRVDIKLGSNAENAEKWIARSNFQDRTIFSEDLIAIHMRRTVLTFNKPITVGMVTLDVSKTLMYDFHYSKMLPKYGSNLNHCLNIIGRIKERETLRKYSQKYYSGRPDVNFRPLLLTFEKHLRSPKATSPSSICTP